MPHLTLEALARLVDEAPESHEETHLAACGECREELDALREQTEALGTLPKLLPPPDSWPELRRRMVKDGIIRNGRRWRPGPALTRVAAALVLFVAGGAAGYLARDAAGAPAERVAETGIEGAPASSEPGPVASASTASAADLTQEVERTEEMFAAALDRFMQASGTEAPDPAARLAALDNIVLTTAEALNESPADPVINSYHLTAVAQRKELIRQLQASEEPVF